MSKERTGTPEQFTTFEILDVFGLKRGLFQAWIELGFVRPSIQKSTRKGEKNHFSRNDLYMIGLFITLLDFCFSRERASACASSCQDSFGEDKTNLVYMTNNVMFRDGDSAVGPVSSGSYEEIKDSINRNQQTFVVNLSRIKQAVDELLERGPNKDRRGRRFLTGKDHGTAG